VFAPDVSTSPETRFIGRLTTKPSPTVVPSTDDEEAASIEIFAYGTPFRPKALTRYAPTGLEETPPRLIHAAHAVFYYYGPGGGGVDYPDVFFFGIRGSTFTIDFFGPYSSDKTPAPETKRIEPAVLASFRTF